MTTLDGVERTLRRRDGARLRPRRARPGSPGSWAARSRRSPSRPPGSCSRSRPGTGSTSCAPRASSGCAPRPRTGSRSSSTRSSRSARQRVASRLMVELCGARLVPGTIDVAAEIPGRAPGRACAAGAPSALLGIAIPFASQVDLPASGSSSRSSRDGDDLEATVPFHRHYDVTREVDLVEEVGRIHGYAEHLPATLPAATRRGRAADPRAAPAPPRRGRAARPRLRRRSSPSASPTPGQPERLRLGDDDPRAAPIADLQPALGRALGAADDAARRRCSTSPATTSPTAPRRVALFESGRAYLREGEPLGGGTLGGELRRAARRRPRSSRWRHRLPGERAAAGRRLGRRGGSSRTSSRSRACSRRSPPGSAARSRSSPASEPFLHPGRAGARARSTASTAGWLGELHPLVCRAWDLDAAAGFEIDLGAAGRRRRRSGAEQYEDVTTYPAVDQDIAVVVDEDVDGGAGPRASVAEAGGELLRVAEVFDLYRGEQVGEGAQEPRAAARVPGRRPHAHRRRGGRAARADHGGAGGDRGVAA